MNTCFSWFTKKHTGRTALFLIGGLFAHLCHVFFTRFVFLSQFSFFSPILECVLNTWHYSNFQGLEIFIVFPEKKWKFWKKWFYQNGRTETHDTRNARHMQETLVVEAHQIGLRLGPKEALMITGPLKSRYQVSYHRTDFTSKPQTFSHL